MKIPIGAYACEPNAGSEPGVGWNWARQAALRGHDVHVVTRANNRPAIEAAVRSQGLSNLTFHYLDLPRFVRALKKGTGYYGILAYYYLWQLRLWFLARRIHRQFEFDIAHHVTFVNYWMPCGLAGLEIPFIWGPVGGSTHVIPRGMHTPHLRDRIYEWSRHLIQLLLRHLDPFVLVTRSRAGIILTYTNEALRGIPRRARRKARSIVHIGVEESELPSPPVDPPPTFTVLAGGRLVHWKGFDLLIEGFAIFVKTTGSEGRLRITGDGPLRPRLMRLARSRNISDLVEFSGWLPNRQDVFEALQACHLYALPTLRDGPPVSILEAMLASRPVLCLDYGATKEMLTPEAGLKIPVESREQVIDGIAGALTWASDHPEALAETGRRGRELALSVHNWRRIGDEVDGIYRELVAAELNR